jgi:hypothetical protein
MHSLAVHHYSRWSNGYLGYQKAQAIQKGIQGRLSEKPEGYDSFYSMKLGFLGFTHFGARLFTPLSYEQSSIILNIHRTSV